MPIVTDDSLWREIVAGGQLDGHPLRYIASVDSTNTLALSLGRAGEKTGTVVVADTQTGGRGRLGKSWLSPPGAGLYASIILRPDLPVKGLSSLTLAAGLAAAKAIEQVCDLRTGIKWPNDVLLAGRKAAGVLVECDLSGAAPLLVLGLGINLTTREAEFPPELRGRATSLLLASGKAVGRGAMLKALLAAVEWTMARMEQEDFAGILEDWRTRDVTLGRSLAWLTVDGQVVAGVSLGPDQEGYLLIRDREGRCHQALSGAIELDPSTLSGYFPESP